MSSHSQDSQAWQRPDYSEPNDSARPAGPSLVDPEDDLPSAAYGGDFETTAIPRYDAGKSADQPAFSLLSEPEPLPYVQPGRPAPMGPYSAEPAEIERDEFIDDRIKAAGRRGTQDLGLLILRVALGGLMIIHGLQKAFGWWDGPGLDGFNSSLGEMGFKNAGILTYAATGGQIAAGVLLVLGLFTPIAAAGALAYLINGVLAAAMAAHEQARLADFLTDGTEYRLIVVVAAAAIILTGPGCYGFDAGRGWARRPFVGSFIALLLGVGGGIAIWVLLNGGNPLG
ncbi:putative oxidoreductase [Mycobacterium frederiksbergense]|uniref:Oxidoreductase n=1 Tax=Mycolicibacterium frederiksbergense TaxID=117567 RepID=A0ABT6L4S1_9MYCO|nr:DoxX family protein [Mycolicibacterium frederiksbergense]MDH6197207.1 putative oxidoreductase [Mycolicibacterium frederiksbergense]